MWTSYTNKESVHYEVNAVPGNPVVGDPVHDVDGHRDTVSVGRALFGTPAEPKVTKLLIWATGDLRGGSDWTLKLGPGARLLTDGAGAAVTTSGTGAFVNVSKDFKGTANAQLQRPVPATPLGQQAAVRTTVLGSKSYEVKHGLVGGIWVLGGAYDVRGTGPKGYDQRCHGFCRWFAQGGPAALGPGTYRFDLSGSAAGIEPSTDVLIWGVDAHLPVVAVRGPTLHVGDLALANVAGGVAVSGRATLAEMLLAAATDPDADAGDGGLGAANAAGAELTGAGIAYNPEDQTLLLELNTPMHQAGAVAGTVPGVLYAVELLVGTTRYEVRALRAAATSATPRSPYFALHRCAPECTEIAQLTGSFGFFREQVYVTVPLTTLGAAAGTSATGIRAATAIGEAATGAVADIDEVPLPALVIPDVRVEVGIAPESMPEQHVAFNAEAELQAKDFSATIPTDGLGPGAYRVWARACVDNACGPAASTPFSQ